VSAHDEQDNGKPNVAVLGRFQIGKSTLINCLLDDRVARTGEGIATTRISTIYTYGQIPSVEVARTWKDGLVVWENTDFRLRDFLNPDKDWRGISATRISLWKPLLQQINLIDTPGIDANADDTALAVASLDKADFVIVLLENKGMCDAEKRLFSDIRKRNLPFAVIINCRDQSGKRWIPKHNREVVETVSAELGNLGLPPTVISGKTGVWPCNLLLFWHASEHLFEDPDGQEIVDDIAQYVNKHLKKKATSDVTFSLSNFKPIRLFFENNHWEKDTDGGEKALFLASPQTVDFLRELKQEHDHFTGTLQNLLPQCWFTATQAGDTAARIMKHFKRFPENPASQTEHAQAEKQKQWDLELARIVEMHVISPSPAWPTSAADALIEWVTPTIAQLPQPYLALCNASRCDGYLRSFSQYMESVKINTTPMLHEIKTVLFRLRSEYEELSEYWESIQKDASGVRDYIKSGMFGQIFTSSVYVPENYRQRVYAFLEKADEFSHSGNALLEPFFTQLLGHWDNAFEPLCNVIQHIASHGQDLAAIAYRDYDSVYNIPHLMDGTLAWLIMEGLDDLLADKNRDVTETMRLYCAHRRLGFVSTTPPSWGDSGIKPSRQRTAKR
jgi:Predicted GTPases